MGIRGNFSRANMSVARFIGGGALSLTVDNRMRSETWKASLMRSGDTGAQRLVSVPSGYYPAGAWRLPIKSGAVSARNSSEGVATVTGSIAAGRNIAGSAEGVATAAATGQLVVSGIGSAAGTATVTGNVTAALGATGSAAGAATATGSITAKGNIVGSSAGAATATAVRYATGQLIGSIAPAITLEASSFSTYLLDEEDVETGLTLRQALRLIAAATAGKVSGAGTSTITIRNAVSDGANRIVATVDSSGNRTAITYNLD